MFSAVVSHTEESEAALAAAELVEQCRQQLGDVTPSAGLLFAAIDFDHETLLREINRALPGVALIGCTTDGEISSQLGFREDSATLFLFASDTVRFTTGFSLGLAQDVGAACQAAAAMARSGSAEPPRLCLALPDGLTIDGQLVTSTLQDALGIEVPIFGALAGDQWRLKSTRQFFGTQVMNDGIAVLLLSGDFQFSYGVATGWQKVGEPGCVTRADGAVVHEIDGAPAIDFFRKYLGPATTPAPELPIAILNAGNDIEYLRATFGEVDQQTGAVTFLATVPVGARVQLMMADRDDILQGCAKSLAIARSGMSAGQRPAAALFFSCAARKLLLGTRTSEELKLIRETLGPVPACGFYGYGEISPHMGASGTKYHNESFVSLLIAE